MGDEYLWDRSGDPDLDIARLERTLGTLRHRDRAYEAPAKVVPLRKPRARLWMLAVAAAIAAGVFVATRPPTPIARPAIEGPAFPVERLGGAPTVNAKPMDTTARLGVGQWLETDPGGRARIAVADIGTVEVGEQSRVRLTKTGPDQHRLDLDRGFISARVNAPPRLFVVGTPAATAVDLGCAYTLEVDDQGRSLLRVTSGWVALEDKARSAIVPAGAACETRPGFGPGTPTYEDAPRPLREAVARFDFEGGGPSAVDDALAVARPRDALTLWHLLQRVDIALRPRVHERLALLAPPPAGVITADVLRLDPTALDRWREALTREAITW